MITVFPPSVSAACRLAASGAAVPGHPALLTLHGRRSDLAVEVAIT